MAKISSDYPELDNAYAIMRQNPQKALEICDHFQSQNPENYLLHLTRIQANTYSGNLQAAYQSANDYVAFRSDHLQPYWMRAEAGYRLGMHDQVISDIKQTMTLDEDEYMGSMPYRLLALSHAHLGNLSKALSYADKAAQMETHEWFPPIGCIPSGTMPQFKAYLTRISSQSS